MSPQLLHNHVRSGNLEHVARGVYRAAFYPHDDQADYIVGWLWSRKKGVMSHDTALSIHGLSDILPARVHMTGATGTAPPLYVLHEGTPGPFTWVGCVPVSTPAQAILEYAQSHGAMDLIEQGIEQGLRRGLFRLRDVSAALL